MSDVTIKIDDALKTDVEHFGWNLSDIVNEVLKELVKKKKTADEKYDEYFNRFNLKILAESIAQLERGEGIVMSLAEMEAFEHG